MATEVAAVAPLFDIAVFDGIEPCRIEIIETVRKTDGKTVYGVKAYPKNVKDIWLQPYRQDNLSLALALILQSADLPDRPVKDVAVSSAKSIDAETLKARLLAMQAAAATNGTTDAVDVKV